jgi:hypothetical protein
LEGILSFKLRKTGFLKKCENKLIKVMFSPPEVHPSQSLLYFDTKKDENFSITCKKMSFKKLFLQEQELKFDKSKRTKSFSKVPIFFCSLYRTGAVSDGI